MKEVGCWPIRKYLGAKHRGTPSHLIQQNNVNTETTQNCLCSLSQKAKKDMNIRSCLQAEIADGPDLSRCSGLPAGAFAPAWAEALGRARPAELLKAHLITLPLLL